MIKIIKITALWCGGCLIMNKFFNELNLKENVEVISLDYDFDSDEVLKYNVGNILPVFIFYKDDIEYKRVIGEEKQELLEVLKELSLCEEV